MTEDGALPSGVRELLESSIHSIEELEVLLIMRGAVVRSWTLDELSRELRLPKAVLTTAMQALVLRRLAIQAGEHTRDRLFAMFSAAFAVLAVNWGVLGLGAPSDEARHFVYAIRLVAFALIVAGIIDKNRRSIV